MNPSPPFKPGTPVFRLRPDFAHQFCVQEFSASPRARDIILDAVRRGVSLPVPIDDYLAVDLSKAELGRYFFYGACGVVGSRRICWYIWDGLNVMPVEREGLFADMLAAATRVYGQDLEKTLSPEIPAQGPFPKWEFAQKVLMHDVSSSTVGLITRAEGQPFWKKKP